MYGNISRTILYYWVDIWEPTFEDPALLVQFYFIRKAYIECPSWPNENSKLNSWKEPSRRKKGREMLPLVAVMQNAVSLPTLYKNANSTVYTWTKIVGSIPLAHLLNGEQYDLSFLTSKRTTEGDTVMTAPWSNAPKFRNAYTSWGPVRRNTALALELKTTVIVRCTSMFVAKARSQELKILLRFLNGK